MRMVFVAGMMLSVLVLAMGTGITETGEDDSEIRMLLQPLDTEARAYLETRLFSSQDLDLDTFAVYLVEKYNRNLSSVIDELEDITEQPLLPKEREDLKILIVREHLHSIFQENIPRPENATVLRLEPILVDVYSDDMNTYNVFYTPMAADNPCPISCWKQVYPDVYGGEGYDDSQRKYDVNGGNGLYRIDVEYNSTWAIYTLFFYDEDHPTPALDAAYDFLRWILYGRTHDIESFIVRGHREEIDFSGIWDNDRSYAYGGGSHGNKVRSYTADTTIYVSNVWNHAMDIYDKNSKKMTTIECTPGGRINQCSHDSDGDGLQNFQEIHGWYEEVHNCLGEIIEYRHVTSDPFKADTDDDGLNDWQEKEGWKARYRTGIPLTLAIDPFEYHVSSDPRNADADSDGLYDWQELDHNTDPYRSDTDCDGAWNTNDGFEVKSGMNPANCDTDDDGLNDGEEIDLWIGACGYSPEDPQNVPQEAINTAVSNAKNPDVDGDGMTDGEEIAYWAALGLAPEEAIVFVGDLDMNQNGMLDSIEHFPSVIRRRGLHKGVENSLVSKIENAMKSLEKRNCNVAINQLQAFINEVEAQRGKKISEELAEMLIQYAQNVIWQIEDWKKR